MVGFLSSGRWRPVLILVLGTWSWLGQAAQGLRQHPSNPRYFEFRGQPTILLTSGEHYGAVLNRDFDFRKYLATLEADRLNYTRIFTGGAYVEPDGAFNIARNTLAPPGERFLAPWARSDQSGYRGGGHRFDLDRWDPQYFARLHDFVNEAARRGIVVEVTLFCPFYEEKQWLLSPFHPANNVNGTPDVARTNVYTLDRHGGLLAIQERLVRKFVEELQGADNIFFEICNEPYFGGVTLEWQAHVARVIQQAQAGDPQPKLVAQNIANGSRRVGQPPAGVSILNFHYATPPTAVAENLAAPCIIGDDETGFRGTTDAPYRMEAWDFLLAGGGLFNHLDYSFAVGHEDGTFAYPPTQPGGGNPAFRRQMRHLRDFLHAFPFLWMRPDSTPLVGQLPAGVGARALVLQDRAWAIYVRTAPLPGQFSARWSGSLQVPATGTYTLFTRSNDGVRLWLDNRPLIDHWDEHSTAEDQAQVELIAGRPYALRVEYFYAGGEATMQLEWQAPGRSREPVPTRALQTATGQPGLQAEYFADLTLSARVRERLEPAINLSTPSGREGLAKFAADQLSLGVILPEGRFQAEWMDTKTGQVVRKVRFRHPGGVCQLPAPEFADDIALAIRRR